MALSAGTRLGPYEILSAVGVGGMGEVYRARDTRLRRDVAIKVLLEHIAASAKERFEREARTASALTHPHICAVYDVGEADGRMFLVMELVEGTTLREYAARQRLTASDIEAIASQIADALEAAHAKGLVHRDVKPGNVMITGRGHVKVLDFGLARQLSADEVDETRLEPTLTTAGTVVGTPQYLSPEVLQGKPADARSDVWALGVVLYELLAGRRPFDGSTTLEISSAILRDGARPLPAGVPAGLRTIVSRCLAKTPGERYQHAGEVRAALANWRTARARRVASRPWVWWTAGAAAALAIAGAILSRPQTTGRLTSTGAPASANQEANDAFELAMQFLSVQNDVQRGGRMFERALALDPQFPEAHRYHAFSLLISILNGYSNDTSLVYKAEEELREARREDPALASLPSAFTAVYLMEGRKELVPAGDLDRVLRRHPLHRDTIFWRAIVAWLGGDNKTVKELINGILEREPLFGAPRMFLGEALRTEGDIAGALREEQRVLEQAPGNISAVRFAALAHLDGADLDRAESVLEAKRPEFVANYLWRSARALVFARQGRRDEAIGAMDEDTLKFLAVAFTATLDAAEFYALLGDVSKSLEWFERAVRNGDERIEWFRRDPRLAAVRHDPRFQRITDLIQARKK